MGALAAEGFGGSNEADDEERPDLRRNPKGRASHFSESWT
jgi:hypothetical protein